MIITASEFWRGYVNYVVEQFADYQDDTELKNAENFDDFRERVYDIMEDEKYYKKLPEYGYNLIMDEELSALVFVMSEFDLDDDFVNNTLQALGWGLDHFTQSVFAVEINKEYFQYFHFDFPLHTDREAWFIKRVEATRLPHSKRYINSSKEEQRHMREEIENEFNTMIENAICE